jgi:hypothetical protein
MTDLPVLRVAAITKSYHLQTSLASRLTRSENGHSSLRALDGVDLQLN